MSWTAPDDVKAAWIGQDVPDDDLLISNWIDRAERLIRRQVTDLQDRIDAEAEEIPPSTDLLDTAKDVTVAMVIRVFRNPEGIRQTNQTTTTGPFSDSKMQTYGGDVPGGLGLTGDELAALQGVSEGAFTIDLIPSTSPFSASAPTGWPFSGWL